MKYKLLKLQVKLVENISEKFNSMLYTYIDQDIHACISFAYKKPISNKAEKFLCLQYTYITLL